MFDLYSFHTSPSNAEEYYQAVGAAYDRILRRVCSHADVPEGLGAGDCGGSAGQGENTISFHRVSADTGEIGGSLSHEYHIGAELGEDDLISCSACGYAANVELHPETTSSCPQCEFVSCLDINII